MHVIAGLWRRRAVGSPVVVTAALWLAACASSYRPASDYPVKIGRPYTVRGVSYVPAADPAYDVLGYASWYGSESGNRSANGEKFRPKAVMGCRRPCPCRATPR